MPAARKGPKRKSKSAGGRKKASKPSHSPEPSKDIACNVEKLFTAVGSNITSTEQALYNEISALAQYIQTARDEIAAIRPDVVKSEHLPAATDELDAIVQSTADATNTIMDAAEIIEGIADSSEHEATGELVDATTRIYEACGFQDITGQRVNKVVAALKHIEKTIDDLISVIESGNRRPKPRQQTKGKKSKPSDEDLLNGPQLRAAANSQTDIDALMDTFD